MATADVMANVSVMMAFENTSPVSVMLIVSTSTLFAMALSIILFQRKVKQFPIHVPSTL